MTNLLHRKPASCLQAPGNRNSLNTKVLAFLLPALLTVFMVFSSDHAFAESHYKIDFTNLQDLSPSADFPVLHGKLNCPKPEFIFVPADVTAECDAVPAATDPIVDPACGPVSISLSESITAGSCAHNYIITRTWTAVDSDGHSAQCTQKVTVQDTTAPWVYINTPGFTNGDTLELDCDDVIPTISKLNVVAYDNCSKKLNIEFVRCIFMGNCLTDGYFQLETYYIKVTDECGNYSIFETAVKVSDNTPPTISGIPADITLDCGSPLPDLPIVDLDDNCSQYISLTIKQDTTAGSCAGSYIVTRTWTATDECGNTATATQVISILDQTPPVLHNVPADFTISCDVSVYAPANVTATDDCSTGVSVSIDEQHVNGSCKNSFTIVRTWTATDDCGNSAQATQKISVVDHTPPVFTSVPASLTIECSDPVPGLGSDVKAIDNCDKKVDITYNDVVKPGKCQHEYQIIRTFTATDDCGNTATATQTIQITDTKAPEIDFKNPIFAGLSEGDTIKVECGSFSGFGPDDFTIVDNCDPNPSFDMVEHILVNTACVKLLKCIATVTDACGNAGTLVFYVEIKDTQSPVLANCPGNLVIECDEPVPSAANVTATDACDPHPKVSLKETIIPGNCPQEKTIIRTWTATDACGNTSSCTQAIEVVDTKAPTIVFNPANPLFTGIEEGDTVKVECGSFSGFGPDDFILTDNCDPYPVFDMVDLFIVNTPCYKLLKCIASATDACGNVSTLVFYVEIKDTQAPVLANCPGNLVIECDEPVPSAANVTATDACDPSPKVNFTENVIPGNCPQEKTIIRTWTAVDSCGNASSCAQTIQIKDTHAPAIDFKNPIFAGLSEGDTIKVECGSFSGFGPDDFTIVDNCDPNPSFDMVEHILVNTACVKLLKCIATVTDACGNVGTLVFYVEIKDTQSPVLANCPGNLLIECDEPVPSAANVTATDACDPHPKVSLKETIIPGNCPQEKTIIRTWTATDACGNTSSCTQAIEVVDTKAPTIVFNPANPLFTGIEEGDTVKVECGSFSGFGPDDFILTDNCDPYPVFDMVDLFIVNTPCYKLLKCIASATDACGNVSTLVFYVEIKDTQAPVLANCPGNLVIECDEPVPSVANVTATDACDPSPKVNFTENVVPGNCPQEKTIIRTWTAVDSCGNASSCSQTIQIQDTKAPSIVINLPGFNNGDTITVDCGAPHPSFDKSNVIVSDNCSVDIDVEFCECTYQGDCEATGFYELITYYVKATDECGNQSIFEFSVKVVDNTPPLISGVPDDVTVGCDDALPALPAVTADDECSETVQLSFSETTASGKCSGDKVITRTWTAVDECGNVATSSQIISVIDNTAPVLVNVPADATISCEETVPPAANVTGTDDCSAKVTVSFHEDQINGACPQAYTLIRTWTATDDCGNTAQATQHISVVDHTAPVFTGIPATTTIECSDPIPGGGTVSATDNCDKHVDFSYSDKTAPGKCPQEYTIIRTWTAVDDCGNTSTAIQEIKVKDTQAPGIIFNPDNPLLTGLGEGDTVKVECGSFSGFGPDDFILSDNCDPYPVFDMIDLFIVNTPCYKLLKCIASATDACGNVGTLVFYVEIKDTQAPVLANCPANITIECDEAVPAPANVTATDACDPNPNVNFTESVVPGNCPQEKTIIRTWTAVDSCGNSAVCTQTIEVQDNTAPEYTLNGDLVGVPFGDTLTIDCDGVLTMDMKSVMFTDNCDTDVPTVFTETLLNGDCIKDGFITLLECTWTGTDDCGNSASYTIYIKVVDNTPPVIKPCPQDITIDCSAPLPPADQVTATDNCDQNVEITVTEHVQAGSCIGNQTIERIYTAADDCGNTTTCKQIITRTDNIAPVISGVSDDVTIECGQSLPNPDSVYATDNCDPNPVVHYASSQTPGPCPQSYTETRTWTATDACGNSSVKTQKITVQDTKAPYFVSVPPSVTVECSDPLNGQNVVAKDECDQDVSLSYNDVKVPGNCPQSYTLHRTYIAADDCGNTASAVQTIHVVDTQAPTIDFNPANPLFADFEEGDTVKVECGVFSGFGPADFILTDNCDPYPVFDMVDLFIVNTPCYKLLKCIASATDACGNVSEIVFYVEITDTTAPVFDNCPPSVVIECDEPLPSYGKVTATDACDKNAQVHFSEQVIPGKCANEKTVIRTWVASDSCGNTAVCTQKIEVRDTKAPEYVLTGQLVGVAYGDTLQLGCDEQLTMDMKSVMFVDNCDPDVPSVFSETLQSGDCLKDGFVTLLECTWTGTDDCGNTTSYQIYIKVVDTKAPVLVGVPADVTIDTKKGEQVPAVAVVTATDNCDLDAVVTFSQTVSADTCSEQIIRTWTAVDDCGNVSQATQVISVLKDCGCIEPIVSGILVKDADCGAENGRVEILVSNGADKFVYNWLPNAGVSAGAGNIREGLPAGTYTVTISYPTANTCTKTLSIEVKATGGNFVAEDTLYVANKNCKQTARVCFGLSVLDINKYDIFDNGAPYTGVISGCDFDTLMSYTYATIPGQGQSGPYILESWVINGVVYSGEFENLTALVALMNQLDPLGNWTINPTTLSISGGNKANVYGQMKVAKKVGSSKATLDINMQLLPNGTSLNLSTGTHNIVFVDKQTHCTDAVFVNVFCLTPEIVNVNVFVNETKKVCTNNSQLQGTPVSIVNVCGNLSGEFSLVSITDTGYCVEITGIEPGLEKACIVVCDDLGFCDTTYINITVLPSNLKPIAVDDYLTARAGKAKTVQVLANDIFSEGLLTMKVITTPSNGKVSAFADKVVVVTPDEDNCDQMSFEYEICNQYGCDTATVHVKVICKELIIYNALSPNNDGLNDYFTIEGIEDYPNNEVSIYNRWGNMVFSAKSYNNDWDGNWNGKMLPDGTYYYILKDGEGESYNGYLQIAR